MKQVAGRLTALFALLLFGAALLGAQAAPAPAQDQATGQAAPSGQAPSQAQPQRTPQSPNRPTDQGGATATSPTTAPDQNAGAPGNVAGGNSLPWLWLGIGIAAAVLLLVLALSGRRNREGTTLLDTTDRLDRDRLDTDLRRDRTDRTDRIDRDDIRRAG